MVSLEKGDSEKWRKMATEQENNVREKENKNKPEKNWEKVASKVSVEKSAYSCSTSVTLSGLCKVQAAN